MEIVRKKREVVMEEDFYSVVLSKREVEGLLLDLISESGYTPKDFKMKFMRKCNGGVDLHSVEVEVE